MEGVSADAPASQTLSVWSSEPDTMVLPSGEKATELMQSLCALCFSANSSRKAASSHVSIASHWIHTLSDLSSEPDTTVLPSGEKATERTESLCALCFSEFSSREAAASVGALRFWAR